MIPLGQLDIHLGVGQIGIAQITSCVHLFAAVSSDRVLILIFKQAVKESVCNHELNLLISLLCLYLSCYKFLDNFLNLNS